MTDSELTAWRLEQARKHADKHSKGAAMDGWNDCMSIEYARLVVANVRPEPVDDGAEDCLTSVLRVIGAPINTAFRVNARGIIREYGDQRAAAAEQIAENANCKLASAEAEVAVWEALAGEWAVATQLRNARAVLASHPTPDKGTA